MTQQPNSAKPTATVPAEDPGARVGSLIKEKWRIDALLGSGGMAAVYSATHRNGQRVALKILHAVLANDTGVRDRFLREGYVANSVGHPAVVAVLDDDMTEDGAPFLVMELLEGETLRDLWKRMGRHLPVVQALQIADPVLDCLSACHVAGVIHRDLKPPNVFITRAGVVKILDFGVAQLRSAAAEKTRAGTALGTPHYMSPEQAMGLVDQLDGRADLFSIGAILHALVTGHRIHTARTENEALILAATCPVPSVARIAPNLPIDVIALIDKALAWDRRNRYTDARDMQAAVRGVLAKLGATAAAGTPSVPLQVGQRVSVPPPVGAVVEPEGEEAADLEELAADDDPRVQVLRDLFKHIERLLPNVRQLGWEHPATERALRTVFQAFIDALTKNPDAIAFSCRPYSFVLLGQTVWEPSAPWDVIPYNLFECGIRTIQCKPGMTLDELRQLLALWMVDPGKDLPPEDDIAGALWDRGLEHIAYETADAFADGDAADREVFYNEADELERCAAEANAAQANSVEARAMAVSTDRSALAAQRASGPMALEEVVRTALADQFKVNREQWSDRYVHVLADAMVNAQARGDLNVLMASIRKSGADLVVAARLDVVLTLHTALSAAIGARVDPDKAAVLGAELTDALMARDTLALAIDFLHRKPDLVAEFGALLVEVSPQQLPVALAAFKPNTPSALRDVLLSYVQRAVPLAGEELVDAISKVDSSVAAPVLGLLRNAGTPAARKMLGGLMASKDPNVRIEARILSAESPEALQAELGRLCADSALAVRMAAYRALARHCVKAATPAVARQIRSGAFANMDGDERKQLFVTLLTLSPDRGEEMAVEIARKGGLLTSEARETSRLAAIDALGELSRSRAVVETLREVALSRWGTSEETRMRAANAASSIESRLASIPPRSVAR